MSGMDNINQCGNNIADWIKLRSKEVCYSAKLIRDPWILLQVVKNSSF